MTALSYTRCPGVPTISAIAHQLGLIDEELRDEAGLEPTYKSVGFNPQLEYGHDDRYWIRNAGHAPAVWKRSKGVDCYLVGLAFLEGSYPVLALRSSGIASAADLKGKRLAVVSRNDGAFDLMVNQQLKVYGTTLLTAGLALSDVELVSIDQAAPPPGSSKGDFLLNAFTQRLELLESGQVDAVTATIPPDAGAFPALNILYDTRLHPDANQRVNPSVLRGLVVSGPLLRERRDIVVRVLTRLLEASEWAEANPLGALRLVAKDLDVPPERLAGSYESVAQGVQLGFDQKRLDALAVQKAFLLEHGLIDVDFDLDEWVDSAALDEARDLLASRRVSVPKAEALT